MIKESLLLTCRPWVCKIKMRNTFVFRAPAPSKPILKASGTGAKHDRLFADMGLQKIAVDPPTEVVPERQKSKPVNRIEQLRMLVEEASTSEDAKDNVLKVAKRAYALEVQATKVDPDDEISVVYADEELDILRRQVADLVNNPNEFAQRLVQIYKAGVSAGSKESKQQLELHSPEPEFKKARVDIYSKIIADLNDISKRALIPLLNFTGMVASKLKERDIRPFLLYRVDNPADATRLEVFDPNVKSREEFLATTRDAGPTITTMFLSVLESEAEANIARLDAAMPESAVSLIGAHACFDIDELDKGVDAFPHPAYQRKDLDSSLERDQQLIDSYQAELRTVRESIVTERGVEPSQDVLNANQQISSKKGVITRTENEIRALGESIQDTLQRQLLQRNLRTYRSELTTLEEEKDELEREPRMRLFQLHDRARVLSENITARQSAMRDRHVLHETREAIKEVGLSDVERRFAPAWAFEVMGSAIFRRVLSTTTLAAFEVALAHVNRIPGCEMFTMKELICSPGVSDMFAFLVAANWISAGDGSETKHKHGRGDKSHNYLNVTRVRDITAAKVMTCKVWFESVVRRPNRLCREFEEKLKVMYVAKLKAAAVAGEDEVSKVYDWEKRMKAYQAMLPQYQLVYTNI